MLAMESRVRAVYGITTGGATAHGTARTAAAAASMGRRGYGIKEQKHSPLVESTRTKSGIAGFTGLPPPMIHQPSMMFARHYQSWFTRNHW
jgi:hypothetical protein